MDDSNLLDKEKILDRLSKSKFRSSFKLKDKDKQYIRQKGIIKVKSHAQDFIRQRLAPAHILNDGKQTPMHGHPVFIAQHACACCCRNCLNKWYKIPKNVELTSQQQAAIVELLLFWINKQMQE